MAGVVVGPLKSTETVRAERKWVQEFAHQIEETFVAAQSAAIHHRICSKSYAGVGRLTECIQAGFALMHGQRGSSLAADESKSEEA
jgi:hypothetical protein